MTALHQQVAETLRSRIRSGTLPAGSRVPSERALAEELRVSRVTLRQALKGLEQEGLLKAEGGARWVQLTDSESIEEGSNTGLLSFSDLGATLGLRVVSNVLRLVTRDSSLDEADLLHIVPGGRVHELVRVRYLDSIPILVDHSLIPEALTPGLADIDFRTESLYRTLSVRYGCEPVRAECAIESREVDATSATHLGLPEGGPVLEIQQITFDATDQVVQWCRSVYRGDRYRFRVVLELGGGTQLTRRTEAEATIRPGARHVGLEVRP